MPAPTILPQPPNWVRLGRGIRRRPRGGLGRVEGEESGAPKADPAVFIDAQEGRGAGETERGRFRACNCLQKGEAQDEAQEPGRLRERGQSTTEATTEATSEANRHNPSSQPNLGRGRGEAESAAEAAAGVSAGAGMEKAGAQPGSVRSGNCAEPITSPTSSP